MGHIAKTPGIDSSEVTGVIFCGGLSRRMGRDKALLEVAGQSLLEKAHGLLRPHVRGVILSTGAEAKYEHMGLPCVLDAEPDLGPIGGLQACLAASQTPWILALACDLPRLPSQWVQVLLGAAQEGDSAVLFGSPDSPEPLFALYHKRLLPRVNASVAAGRRRMTSFLSSTPAAISESKSDPSHVRWLPMPAQSEVLFSNVNRPEDWQNYQNAAGHLGGDRKET